MRIGIVNDMALAREALRRVVASSPEHAVAWLATDGLDAIEHARRDPPDLILMDLVMPGVDGVEATRRIMAENACPIVIVTSTVHGNLGKVYDAMALGALDVIDTPTLGARGEVEGGSRLLAKVATVGKLIGKPCRSIAPFLPTDAGPAAPLEGQTLVAIGCSTGGPNALAQMLSAFPDRWDASVVVVQHVDVGFASGLARWLAERSGKRVGVAEPGSRPEPGRVLIAATNDHLILDNDGRFRHVAEPVEHCFRPSVDVFFASLTIQSPDPGVAVVLTGMGRDGALGLLALRNAGWHTIAQDEATSVVWGMPRAAIESGAAVEVLPLSEIGAAVVEQVRQRAGNARGYVS